MSDYIGQFVRAAAGRDKGNILCVVGMDNKTGRLLLADGKRRKIAHPKAKKLGHVTLLTGSQKRFDHPVAHSLQQGEPVSDRALRRALAAFKEGSTLGER